VRFAENKYPWFVKDFGFNDPDDKGKWLFFRWTQQRYKISSLLSLSMYLDFFIVQDKDKAQRDYKTFKPEALFIVIS